jgi:fructoselysine and glucoselysine-specific PTS system IIB component
MIKLLRVDHRLLHGQVAFSWTNTLGADCILIANDDVVNDEIHKTTLKLAKPHGVRLVIKNIQDSIESILSGVTDKYKLLIVVSSIEDAYKLATAVEEISSINLGGVKAKEGTRAISQTINVFPYEEELLHKLIDSNIEVEIRQVPTDKKLHAKNVLSIVKKIK